MKRTALEMTEFSPAQLKLIRAGVQAIADKHIGCTDVSSFLESVDYSSEFDQVADFHLAISTYLIQHCQTYIDAETISLTSTEKVRERALASARGYFAFATANPHEFSVLSILNPTTELPQSFDTNLNSLHIHPGVRLSFELVRDAILELDGPRDLDLWISQTIVMASTVQGITHLCTFGAARYLNATARRQTFMAVHENILKSLQCTLSKGLGRPYVPTNFVGEPDFASIPPAISLPKDTVDQQRWALVRGAVEVAVAEGLDNMDVQNSAARAGLTSAAAMVLFDPEKTFRKSVEDFLDMVDQQKISAQIMSIPGQPTGAQMIKAAGFGYVGFAFSDPCGFETLIEIASGSIVPASFEADDDRFPKGFSFGTLLDLVRQTIIEGGGPKSPWILFEQTISLWATAHGLAIMCVNGPLSGLSNNTKFNFMAPVMDTALDGMIQRLGLIEPERA
ncbi:TetR-like C-terminal domain-containing protein [Corynebacterium rouxii]|uniref:WHG domain-containing protein n=1 Tax=Corynebacterium rouxii TaxID=2719119 RepID=A0ABU3PP11_9CORY|nr:hypothetical protein [Corynebacterium rouxii]MDT9409333.1 hypothetical protein [Corynebacterium rouxii]MDT9411566.1 hypothetical protein [Corynebacterium rouxii]